MIPTPTNPLMPHGGHRLWLRLLAAGTLALATVGALAQSAARPPAVPAQALEQALKSLLKSQPELVRQALDDLQRREAADQQRQARRALAESAQALMSDTGTTVLGNPQGDVTLVEFIDYRCGYCKQVSASVADLLRADPGLRVLVKHLPILGQESIDAAQLAISVGQGPAAQALHDALMAAPGLDAETLRALTPAPASGQIAWVTDKVAANRALGEVRLLADRLGIQGTPALVIGDTLIRGAADPAQLAAAIQALRAQRPGARHLADATRR